MKTRTIIKTISIRVQMEIPDVETVADAEEAIGEARLLNLVESFLIKQAVKETKSLIDSRP